MINDKTDKLTEKLTSIVFDEFAAVPLREIGGALTVAAAYFLGKVMFIDERQATGAFAVAFAASKEGAGWADIIDVLEYVDVDSQVPPPPPEMSDVAEKLIDTINLAFNDVPPHIFRGALFLAFGHFLASFKANLLGNLRLLVMAMGHKKARLNAELN